ncbi:MAG TPA: hypothetical protein VNL69_02060 [Bacteroidota bacterium]|nr:hypothetical protein [Bacteroidota bacterium]
MDGDVSALRQQDRTTLLLVLGLLSFLFGPLTGIPTWVMAHQDIRDIRMGFLNPSFEGRLRLARALGIIGTFINIVTLFLFFVLGMIALVVLAVVLGGALS